LKRSFRSKLRAYCFLLSLIKKFAFAGICIIGGENVQRSLTGIIVLVTVFMAIYLILRPYHYFINNILKLAHEILLLVLSGLYLKNDNIG
jgi:hypothetical protein